MPANFMLGNLQGLGIQLAVLVCAMAAIALVSKRLPHLGLGLLAIGFIIIVETANTRVFGLIPKQFFLPGLGLQWAWFGKLLAIAATVALIAVIPQLSFRSAGVTLRQQPGPVVPVLIAGAILCLWGWGGSYLLAGHGEPPSVEAMLYQASLPGIEEELAYRGAVPVLLNMAFHDQRRDVLGAAIGWGGLLTALFFGLAHSITVASGELIVMWPVLLYTLVAGTILTWMRERSGSLLAPVLGHNAVNFGNLFI